MMQQVLEIVIVWLSKVWVPSVLIWIGLGALASAFNLGDMSSIDYPTVLLSWLSFVLSWDNLNPD